MTTIDAQTGREGERSALERLAARNAPPHADRPRLRAWSAIAAHSVVDYFSYLIVPLMPLLVTRLDLTDAQRAWVLASGSVASGAIQPLVAWLSDRLNTRWLGTLGLVLAAVATSLLGFAGSFQQLMVIQLLSSLGIGAFHPVAAAAVGQLFGSRRSMGVSMFFLGGMIGGISGNLTAAAYVALFGLANLWWLMLPGLAFAVLLGWAIHGVAHTAPNAHADHAAIDPRERRWRWAAVWLLYAGSAIRFTVNAALVYLFIDWSLRLTAARKGLDLDALDAPARQAMGLQASGVNGWLQAAMQIGMGAAALGAGWLLRPGSERRAVILVPVLGAAAIALTPWAQHAFENDASRALTVPVVFLLTVVAGVGFGGIVPVTIALAQRMLPHRTSLASGLMMGGAWSLAALGPLVGKWFTKWFGPTGAWWGVAALLLLAGAISLAIPAWLVDRVTGHRRA